MIRRRPRCRSLLPPLAAGALLATGLALAPSGAPAGAVGPGWTVTVDPQPVATGPVVVATGRASLTLGLGIGQVRSVRVRLVPRVELPEPCGPFPLEATGPVSGGGYRVELRPACNGPYRAEVVASGTFLGQPANSGSPAVRDLALADPGPAPAPPAAAQDGGLATVTWASVADPDLTGWTVVRGGGAARDVPAGTTRVAEPVAPGDHGFQLVARRWGAEGPGGPMVASPPSGATALHVAPREAAQPPANPSDPPGGATAGPAAGSSGATPPGRRGAATTGRSAPPPSRRAPAPGSPGYRDELPYGPPDEASVPGADAEPGGEQVAAGTSPSARVVRTSERTSPGLVAPFALSLLLLTAALGLAAYLRRAARSPAVARA